MKCDICKAKDSGINPILSVKNASKFDVITKVCTNCASIYDGLFARNDNGELIFI